MCDVSSHRVKTLSFRAADFSGRLAESSTPDFRSPDPKRLSAVRGASIGRWKKHTAKFLRSPGVAPSGRAVSHGPTNNIGSFLSAVLLAALVWASG